MKTVKSIGRNVRMSWILAEYQIRSSHKSFPELEKFKTSKEIEIKVKPFDDQDVCLDPIKEILEILVGFPFCSVWLLVERGYITMMVAVQ